jgi:hypothetical protein
VSAIVTLSVPLFGERRDGPIKAQEDALVTLSNSSNSFNIPFDSEKGIYFSKSIPFPILPGNTYSLTVRSADGKIVSAQCTVPMNSAVPTDLTITKAQNTGSFGDYSNESLKAQWQDIAGEKNYYLVTMSSSDTFNGNLYVQPIYLFNNLVTDEQADGKLITYREEYNFGSIVNDRTYELNLHTLDYNAYEFKKTQKLNDENGPFSTPASVHSNIQNGLGVFGAYRKSILIKK